MEIDKPEPDGTYSNLSGSAADVVQARDVSGGIHFHGSSHGGGSAPHQLPGGVRGFVGRGPEIEWLDQILAECEASPDGISVAAIVGTAGVGKTSLAVHWAHRVRDRFPDGQLYVNLRGYDPGLPVPPEQALDRFLRALGVPPGSIPADLEARAAVYRSLLVDRRILIVLDNVATVRQVRPLLPGTASCPIVVTSRSRLSGLSVRDGAHRLTLDVLGDAEAVQLLRETTAAYRGGDDSADLAELARLCARLPLALRIAAERAASRPWMPLSELIQDLRDESALWDALSAEEDEDADAVRTVFAWSYRALPEGAARLFRLLGLHPGPDFSVPAAAVLVNTTPRQARHSLDVLVGAHLLEQTAPERFQFHDLLRAYAANQAGTEETVDERRSALERVLTWYLHTADAAVAVSHSVRRRAALDPFTALVAPLRFTDQAQVTRWYETERSNLVAATRVAAELGFHQIAWQLAAVLRGLYVHRNPFEDWFATARTGLASARHLGDRYAEAEMLESLGQAYRQSHHLPESIEQHTASLAIRREIADRPGEAMSANGLGLVFHRDRQLTNAQKYFEQSIALFEEIGDLQYAAIVRSNLAATMFELGRLDTAERLLLEALATHREGNKRVNEIWALGRLSRVQCALGRPSDALRSAELGLTAARDLNNPTLEGQILTDVARAQQAVGEFGDALVSYQRSATIHRQLGDRSREAVALDGAGQVYRRLGRQQDAVAFHRQAVAIQRDLDDSWQLACALDNLATALRQAGEFTAAVQCWTEAKTLLERFPDPGAARSLSRVDGLLATATSS